MNVLQPFGAALASTFTGQRDSCLWKLSVATLLRMILSVFDFALLAMSGCAAWK